MKDFKALMIVQNKLTALLSKQSEATCTALVKVAYQGSFHLTAGSSSFLAFVLLLAAICSFHSVQEESSYASFPA